jgi:hypothetical protein
MVFPVDENSETALLDTFGPRPMRFALRIRSFAYDFQLELL